MQDIDHLVDSDIWITRWRFFTLSSLLQRQWLLDSFHMHTCSESEENTNYIVCGKVVCLLVRLSVLGLSKSHFYEVGGCLIMERFEIWLPKSLLIQNS